MKKDTAKKEYKLFGLFAMSEKEIMQRTITVIFAVVFMAGVVWLKM